LKSLERLALKERDYDGDDALESCLVVVGPHLLHVIVVWVCIVMTKEGDKESRALMKVIPLAQLRYILLIRATIYILNKNII